MTVTLAGGPADESYTSMTDAEGMYSFAELRPGSYTISISDFDSRDYEFASTSQDVSVNLDETGTVSFTGVLLRTSGIAGRVSVEGMGLGDITVTLSGADDRTAMTDASGQYAFAGLAAGDYMVSIMVESNAYVFSESETSKSVTVGDDESKIVNFEGDHDTSASVSGMLYVDEATKNDMHDEGEDGFPSAAVLQALQAAGVQLPPVLPIPITLHGPGVNQMQSGSLNLATGQFSFGMLRAGDYELRVGSLASALSALPAEAAAVLRDFEYGGPAAGYPLTVGVGEAVTQNVPVDITHTTVHFAVHLRHGDDMGDALSGATVGFYSDKAGGDQVAMGKTGETGMAMIRFARAGTTGNMVYAGVTAPDGFDVAGDMQMVAWDPKSPMSAAANSQDVVNLKAEFSFAGATVTTAMGGGKALAGWGIDVLMMGDDGMEAVEGAPEMLDDDGMASITLTAESAADLPMTYYVALNADQDDELDGGENYETTDTLPAMLTGLSTSTEMDAGTLEARYTTQTLVVSVYREVDQVPGYTGNIGTADVSTSDGVDIEVRHETPSNRRGTFDPKVWKWVEESGSDQTVWKKNGVYTLKGLPADHNVFVLADEDADDVEVLYPDNLAAFENAEANGIMGGAFGSEGGFHHTVSLCPHTKVDPTGQDFGECGSFGFVKTYTVAAHVEKKVVEMDDDDAFKMDDDGNVVMEKNIPGIELGFSPVEGKNMAGEAASLATEKKAVRSAGEGASSSTHDDEVDERQDLYFGRMAEGVYSVSVSDNWEATIDGKGVGKEFRLEEAEEMDVTDPDRTGASGPFRPDDEAGVYIEVRPTTTMLYGVVKDDAGDPLEEATVTVNGVTVETDIDGRYIVEFSAKRSSRNRDTDALFISASKDGYKAQVNDPDASGRAKTDIEDAPEFKANTPERKDITLPDADLLATVTGTVTDKDGDPVSGVEIRVTDENDKNVLKNPSKSGGDFRATGDDGTYTLSIMVEEDDADYTITPSKNRYYFDNTDEIERLESGDEEDGVDFEALRQSRIRGSVRGPDGGMEGVEVTATARGREDYTPSDDTNANGRFTIWVDGDERYDITAADKDGYTFAPPEDGDADGLRVDDDETHEIGVFMATTFGASDVTPVRDETDAGNYDGNLTVTWEAGTVPEGHTVTYQAYTKVGDDARVSFGDLLEHTAADLEAEGSAPDNGKFMVIVEAKSDNGTPDDDTDDPEPVVIEETVEAISIGPSLTTAKRNDDNEDQLDLAFKAKTAASGSQLRIVVQVEVSSSRKEWVVAQDLADVTERAPTIDLSTGGSWSLTDGSGTIDVTAAMLEKALKVAVEALQGEFDADDNQWERSNVRDVKAKP